MADLLVDTQSPPATPAAGQSVLYVDSVSKKWASKNDAGLNDILADIEGFSTANQTGFAADTYLAGSAIAMPGSLAKAGSMYYLCFDMVKTAAGVATPILTIRFGTAGSVADTARLTFTFAAGTAVADTGTFEVWAHWRNVGAASVLVGKCRLTHHTSVTGLASNAGTTAAIILLATSAAFDSTVPASILGASFNGGTAFAGTNTVVQSRLSNT